MGGLKPVIIVVFAKDTHFAVLTMDCNFCNVTFDGPKDGSQKISFCDLLFSPDTPILDTKIPDDFNMDVLTPVDVSSSKRKSSEDDSPIPLKHQKVSAQNPQFGAGDSSKAGPSVEPDDVEPEYQDRTAFNKKLFTRQYKHRGSSDILVTGEKYKAPIKSFVQHYMQKHRSVTFFIVFQCKLLKYNSEGEEEYTEVYFHGKNRRLLTLDEFEENYVNAMDTINTKLGNFMTDGSGWMMDSIKHVNLNIAKYTPITGSSYIPTPQCLVKKMALVNVQNEDQNCFLYSVLASVHPNKNNVSRVSSYKKHLNTLKLDGIEMPMATKDIDKFEKLNDLAINVYGCSEDGTGIWPRRDHEPINLLMLMLWHK